MEKKKKFIRRVALSLLMVACFATSFCISAEATSNTYSISYWYSDSNIVGYWSDRADVFVTNTSTSFNVVPYVVCIAGETEDTLLYTLSSKNSVFPDTQVEDIKSIVGG